VYVKVLGNVREKRLEVGVSESALDRAVTRRHWVVIISTERCVSPPSLA